ncbi:DUF4227 family protein [Thermobacillus sp. ZCTH02-B1]|uniref:DUF4227 family protein n=1 Tax=Thermobacillus sp. ZCTH02-B1 TaxID=1858795 RepID=UPI0025FA779B|nr:DUF4227 family protein [Thermobacillus sp. ZCTH02-B1]
MIRALVLSLRRALRRLLFIALFLALTLAIAEVLRPFAGWIGLPETPGASPDRPALAFAGEPEGGAEPSFLDRLRLFWLAGG